MKNYNEIAENVLNRRDEYIESRRLKRKKQMRITAFAGCFAAAVLAAFSIGYGGMNKEKPLPEVESSVSETDENKAAENTSKDEVFVQFTEPTTTENQTVPDEGLFSSGGEITGIWCIPALPFDRDFELTGELITDEEAKAYFDENGESIISSLASSGVSADSIRIEEKGYCHVSYDGTEGKCFEIRQNYRDYLVYNGDELAAIITLRKDNGEIYNTPSFGAKWFENYNSYLREHKGEKLVYVYASWFEIIIAPDNTYFNPMGFDVDPYLEGFENPYEVFYHEAATYIP